MKMFMIIVAFVRILYFQKPHTIDGDTKRLLAIPIHEHKTISDYPYFLKFATKDAVYDIEYTKRISGLVFQAKLLLNGTGTIAYDDVIVKFSSQYGYEPHNICADNNFSPKIIYYEHQPPWHIVREG